MFLTTEQSKLKKICESDDNFDNHLKKSGQWGHALYFFESAYECEKDANLGSYSTDANAKQMILASVLVGKHKIVSPD